jgi:hypothetical protein
MVALPAIVLAWNRASRHDQQNWLKMIVEEITGRI